MKPIFSFFAWKGIHRENAEDQQLLNDGTIREIIVASSVVLVWMKIEPNFGLTYWALSRDSIVLRSSSNCILEGKDLPG